MPPARLPSPTRRRALVRLAAAGSVVLLPSAARAADERFPQRPIRLVVPFAPGNQLDIYARRLAEHVARSLKQPVVVENRAGASGNLASEFVARSAPDGSTLLISGVLVTLLPSTLGARAVDPVAAFAPVTRLVEQPIVVAVHPSLGVSTLAELIARARATPGGLPYATSGIGTAQHLAATMLAQRGGFEWLHVPYANTGEMMKDALAGTVPVVWTFQGSLDPHFKAGRLRPVAVTTATRTPALPATPTIAESGFPGFDVTTWAGILAPAGTPRAIVGVLHDAFVDALGEADVREMIATSSATAVGNTPEQFAAEIRESTARWASVVRVAGIRVD